jgi:capsular polysaccharide export protein
MKIAILNNAANYLYFNVNFTKYLERSGYETVFLNTDLFIKRQLKKHNIKVDDYKKTGHCIDYYNEDSGIIKYLKRLYRLNDTKKLIQIKNKEYTDALHYFKGNDYDTVLILNGAFNVETDVCRELNIKTFFFEHAYIPKAIQMDSMGVNSGASFANLNRDRLLSFTYPETEFKPMNDFKFTAVKYPMIERYLFRIFDANYNLFFSKYIRRKRNLTSAKKRFKSFKEEILDIKEGEKYIFFPLQVNSDTQIILNSPYKSMYEAIDAILPVLKKTGYKIVIKEHPMEVEPVDYKKYIEEGKVFVVKKIPLDTYIEHADFVVNINSSVGFQALSKYKKVLLLGESFYKNSPLSVYYQEIQKNDLLDIMDKIQIDKEITDHYLKHFNEHIFLKGHFYTPDIDFFERIKNRMEGSMNQ